MKRALSEQASLDLSQLTIHQLDVVPIEGADAIEFQLHATLEGVDADAVEKMANETFVPSEVVGKFIATETIG